MTEIRAITPQDRQPKVQSIYKAGASLRKETEEAPKYLNVSMFRISKGDYNEAST